jgi:hypothetical protein
VCEVYVDVVTKCLEFNKEKEGREHIRNMLSKLGEQMGFQHDQQTGLECLRAMYSSKRSTPIRAVGYQTTEDSVRLFDRWWYEDTSGSRCYFDCIAEDDGVNVGTTKQVDRP